MTSVLFTFLVLMLGFFGVNHGTAQQESTPQYGNVEGVLAEQPVPTKILFTGDMMLARDVELRMESEDPANPFAIFNHFTAREYAAVVANFEAAVPEVHQPTPLLTMQFSVSSSTLERLHSTPVTHLSLANNHSTDYGANGFSHTDRTLTEYGFTPFGHRAGLNASSTTFISTGNADVAVLAIEKIDQTISATHTQAFLREVSEVSDVQVAYVHFGTEYMPRHNEAQAQVARTLIDAGVEVVIGHHPHVVQDVERYKDGIIFYSLGNFIFDQYFSREVQEGLLLDASFHTTELEITLHPVTSVATPTVPRLLTQAERERFLSALASSSTPSLAESIQKGVVTIPLASSDKRAIMAGQ